MNKLDAIMQGFGITEDVADTSKDISEDAEKESNNIKVKKAEVITETVGNVGDIGDIMGDDIGDGDGDE